MSSFWATFFPFMINFVLGRAILQADLIMISDFGSNTAIAFGIPSRIMILDVIVAFALAPVISVFIAKLPRGLGLIKSVQEYIAASFWIGTALTFLGLLTYPFLIRIISPSQEVQKIALSACLWLTLCIPFRLQQFAASMALHGLGRGWLTTYVSAGSVVLNIALNYLFAWKLQMGPVGIYVSTFFISVLSAGLHLWMLDRKISIQSFQWLKMSFYRNLFVTIFPEMGRVASERLLAFVLLGLFTFLGSPSESMQAFVICSEFLFLLTAPLVALMRSVAVLSAQNQERMKKSMKFFEEPLLLLLICGLGVLVFAYSPFIFEKLYKVHQYTDWYGTFVWALPFYIVAKWGNSIYRGYLQSQKKLKAIFWVDSIGQWTLLIPLSAWAIYQNSPKLFWGGWVFVEVLSWMVLFVLWQPGIRYRVAPLLRIKRRA